MRRSPRSLSADRLDEVGEGCKLDGAVGGDVANGERVFGETMDGSDVVELWRRDEPPCDTRYERGGGGAKGVSSSVLSTEREFALGLCCVSLLLEDPVTSFQIFLRPRVVLLDRAWGGSGTSGLVSMRGHDSPRRNVGALLPMSTTSGLGYCGGNWASRASATLRRNVRLGEQGR